MSSGDDYPALARLASTKRGASDVERSAANALEELDWLRAQVGELLARLVTVAGPDEWKRPI